ncbi:BEACH domain-containing protein LvsA-like protein [Tanacetum coccineum]
MFIASLWTSIVAWFTPTILFCVTNIIIATIYIVSNNNTNKHNDHAHSDSISRITRVSSFLSRTRSVNLSSYIPTTTIVTSEPQHNYEYQSNPPSYTSSSRLAQSIHQSPSYVAPLELSNDYETSSFECEKLPLSDQLTRTPSILERVKSIKLSSFYTEPEHITNSSSRQLDRVPSFFDRVKSFKISSPFTYETPSTQTDHHVIRSKSENTTSVIKKKGLVSEMKKSRSEMRIADDDDEDDVDLRRPVTTRESRTFGDEEVDVKADHFINRFKQQLRLQRL